MKEEISSSRQLARKRYIIGLIVSVIVCMVMTGMSILIQTLSGRKFPEDGLLIWINALTTSGGLMMMFYLLVILTDNGAFDLIGYSLKLVWYNTFHRNLRRTNLAATFHEYRLEKQKNRREFTVNFMLYAGLLFLAIGLLLLIPFYQNM